MPSPKQFKDQDSFMQACVPMMMKDKSMENDQAVAACMNMWKNRDKATNNTRSPLFSNAFRQVKQGDKDFLVVPGIPLHEQVMNTYLMPAEEIIRSVKGWNGTAISIHHPHLNDGSVNVPDPDVAIIGRFYNARWESDAKRMSGEYWIDLAEAEKYKEGKEIVAAVRANKILETSTGYYADDEEAPGSFEGKDYRTIHRNLLPDHIAILPKAIGACSVRDGCGVNRNIKLNECDCDCPFKNESLDQRAENVRRAFMQAFQSEDCYPREVFDDYVIASDADGMYKVLYAKDTEGNYTFDTRDKWQKVELQYVETNAQIPDYQPDHLPRMMLEGYAFNKGIRTPEQIASLRDHMAEHGIDKPVVLMRKEDGEIKILDGNHRVSMAKDFNIDQIPVKAVGEDLQPIDPEMMYREWQHMQDQGYLNQEDRMNQNGDKHPWHKGRPGEVGGSTSDGSGGGKDDGKGDSVSKAQSSSARAEAATKKAMETGSADDHAKARDLHMKAAEDNMNAYREVRAENPTAAEGYKRAVQEHEQTATIHDKRSGKKKINNRESRSSTSTAVSNLVKEPSMKNLKELIEFLQGKGITVKQNEAGEFEVEEPTTPAAPNAITLSAEEITALKALAAKATPEAVQNFDHLKDVPAAVRLAQSFQAQEEAEKEQLIATIKANSANPYSDEELKAMPKVVLTKMNAQMNVSFAGLGGAEVFTNASETPLGLRPILLAPANGGK